MESNRTVQVNWGTFNVPTLLSVLGILWYTATHTERQDSRLDINETALSSTSKLVEDLRAKTAALDNVTYRLTTLETVVAQNNANINARVDRQSDALQDIRKGIGDLSTGFEVLSNKVDTVLGPRKSEIVVPPPELARRN